MGTDIHARRQAESGRTHPPAGRDDDHTTRALRSGRDGPTQRKSVHHKEAPTRDAGRDDRRSGSDSGKPD